MILKLINALKQLKLVNKKYSHQKHLENLENQTKNACREYISKIMLYLEEPFFTVNNSNICEKEWEDVFLTHLLFGLCCFLLFKYNKNRLDLLYRYVKCFETILANIERKSIIGHMRVLVIDFLYQIILLENQFKNELDVLKNIAFESNENGESLTNNVNEIDNKVYSLMLAGHIKIALN